MATTDEVLTDDDLLDVISYITIKLKEDKASLERKRHFINDELYYKQLYFLTKTEMFLTILKDSYICQTKGDQ